MSINSSAQDEVAIRAYDRNDYDPVSELWIRINRELAPPNMKDQFEHYIRSILEDELKILPEKFSALSGSAFWVVGSPATVIGCFGIERIDEETTELRRMYLDKSFRGQGLAERMVLVAEDAARGFGYRKMILSTAEIQRAAVRFYEKQGYRFVKAEIADSVSVKTIGGGIQRFHFEKELR